MNNLAKLIKDLNLEGNALEITNALNAKTSTKLNNTPQTTTSLILALGMDDARTAISGLQTVANADPLMAAVYQTLNSNGIDFSNPVTQAQINALTAAGVWSSDIGNKLLAIGSQQVSPYENWAGIGQVVLIDDVSKAIAIPPTVFDSSHTALSVSIDPNGMAIHCRVSEATIQNGIVVCGNTLSAFSCGNTNLATLTNNQQNFVNAINSAIQAYIGGS